MVAAIPRLRFEEERLSVLALSSRFDGLSAASSLSIEGLPFSTRSVESF